MNKEEVLDHALSLKYGGMSRGELSCLYDFCKDKTVLELGSMVGMSSYVIASVCKNISCVDIWNDTFDHVSDRQKVVYENDWVASSTSKMVDVFKLNCKVFLESGKMRMVRGETSSVCDSFENENFDLVMIDAGHEYEEVLADIGNYIRNVKEDGNLLFHDYGCTMWTGVSQACDEYVARGKMNLVRIDERIAIFKIEEQ